MPIKGKMPCDKTFITGISGCGKSALSKFLADRALDLDWIGQRARVPDSISDAWIVDPNKLALFANYADAEYFLGICQNYNHPITTFHVTSTRRKVTREYAAISSLEWARRIVLWYNPTPEEMSFRFTKNRDNDYGQTPQDRSRIKLDLEAMKAKPPVGFEFIDVTGCRTPQQVMDLINGVSKKEEQLPADDDGSPVQEE